MRAALRNLQLTLGNLREETERSPIVKNIGLAGLQAQSFVVAGKRLLVPFQSQQGIAASLPGARIVRPDANRGVESGQRVAVTLQ